jgi:mannose-6-phosphate isomerase-like protein (cupin superfamily)
LDGGDVMRVYHPADYTGERAWAAIDIERIADASIRLHWTDKPYVWHFNDGPEVLVVVDGVVDMQMRKGGSCETLRLSKGDIFHAVEGDEHRAEPVGEARILVIERAGSI